MHPRHRIRVVSHKVFTIDEDDSVMHGQDAVVPVIPEHKARGDCPGLDPSEVSVEPEKTGLFTRVEYQRPSFVATRSLRCRQQERCTEPVLQIRSEGEDFSPRARAAGRLCMHAINGAEPGLADGSDFHSDLRDLAILACASNLLMFALCCAERNRTPPITLPARYKAA